VADPQTLQQNKEEAEDKLVMTDYELRLAQEDITKLKAELQTKTEYSTIDDATMKSSGDVSVNNGGGQLQIQQQKGNNHSPVAALGPVKENERQDLNCAVKEYLLIAGYRLTAMTFYEEVSISFMNQLKCLSFSHFMVLMFNFINCYCRLQTRTWTFGIIQMH